MATTGMSFGMTVNLLQSVGIVGMMTVEWPEHLQGFLAAFKAEPLWAELGMEYGDLGIEAKH